MEEINLNSRIISEIGVSEKYIRKEHFNSIKVWWARRPITAMRNLLIQETLKRNAKDVKVSSALVSEINPPQSLYKEFSNKFKTKSITVLDVFSGGGSIPFEGSRLGFQVYSSELNPIAVLAQRTVFDSLKIENFSTILKKEGLKIIDLLEKDYSYLYYHENYFPYVFYWSRTMACKSCHKSFNLSRLRYFSKRNNNTIEINQNNEDNSNRTNDNTKGFNCEHCGQSHSFFDIKEYCISKKLGDNLLAICKYDKKKEYIITNSNFNRGQIDKEIRKILEGLDTTSIDWEVEARGGVINPTLYDLKDITDFFNSRQHLIILGLISKIISLYPEWVKFYNNVIAEQLVYALTSLVEFLVDWNSKGTMWISQNEQTGRSLAGPGVGMKWDYIEVNPFFEKGSNLRSKLLRVCDTFEAIKHECQISILQGSSTSLQLPDESIDIILTDPPYYDSIEYTALSEFFRPWFELLIRNTSKKNINLKNNETQEAIVAIHKKGKLKKDNNHYKQLMTGVLTEVKRVLKSDGSCLLLYSHKTFEGWSVIANAILDSGLFISDCYPIEMERIARPRAMQYDALNGVIVFRILKNNDSIQSTRNDIAKINNQLLNREILKSHIVIYLAALACKEFCLNGGDFGRIHKDIITEYQIIQLENWDIQKFDLLSKSFLLARVSPQTLSNTAISLLKNNKLLGDDGNTVSIMDIDTNLIQQDTVLYTVNNIFRNYKTSSKPKFSNPISEESLLFISYIAGPELNTVKKRTSIVEAKMARLILSKYS